MCVGITFKTNFFHVRVFWISRSNPISPKCHLLPYLPAALSACYFFFPAWTEGNFKLAPSELESSSSLQFVQGFLAFSDNIVIHFLSSQNRYQDMIVKTLNCELRRAHVIRQPQQAKAERAAVRTPFLPFFIQKSREVWASNLLLPCHRTWHSNSVRRDSQ